MPFTPMQWRSEFETRVEEIDLQHRFFLRLINRLGEELSTAQDPNYRQRLIDELHRYAKFHFLSEENLMVKFGYPAFDSHRKHHLDLLDNLSSRANNQSRDALLQFLTEWFCLHTVHEDRPIGDFILGPRRDDAVQG